MAAVAGVSNEFLVRTEDPAAITYNDVSPNENTHLATAFRLLGQPGNAFLQHLPHEDYR
jgi:hypothetical protein